ncbi:MAG: carboxypeptidase-like regulatory domain-containing protein [Pyrinomonadaceae bacterium]
MKIIQLKMPASLPAGSTPNFRINRKRLFPVFLFLLLCQHLAAPAQTGGGYDLSHNVIASGGGSQSTGASFTLDGTIGQGIAGTVSSGGTLTVRGGFWPQNAFAPTAAGTSISGRIRTADGQGIRSVSLSLTNASTGEISTTLSSSFGYYRFEEIPVGQIYILTVSAKRFSFNPDTRVITLLDELTDEDFNALPLK